MNATTILADLGISAAAQGGDLAVRSPVSGELIGNVKTHSLADVDAMLSRAREAFDVWRNVPAPRRYVAPRNQPACSRDGCTTTSAGRPCGAGVSPARRFLDSSDRSRPTGPCAGSRLGSRGH